MLVRSAQSECGCNLLNKAKLRQTHEHKNKIDHKGSLSSAFRFLLTEEMVEADHLQVSEERVLTSACLPTHHRALLILIFNPNVQSQYFHFNPKVEPWYQNHICIQERYSKKTKSKYLRRKLVTPRLQLRYTTSIHTYAKKAIPYYTSTSIGVSDVAEI